MKTLPSFLSLKICALLALIQLCAGLTRVAAAYNLAGDFSTVSNPAGAWRYGATANLGSTFVLFSNYSIAYSENLVPWDTWNFGLYEPTIIHNPSSITATGDNGQGIYPPNTVVLYPGGNGIPYGYGVVRFTVPGGQSGYYSIQTSVQSALSGLSSGDSDFHVLNNEIEVFGMFLPGNSSTSYVDTLFLNAGDIIEFAVGRGLDGNGDFSGLKIQANLALVPEPSVFALSILGAAGLLAVRRRK